MRLDFYEKIYNFSAQNLSFFPAQSGEMELLADKCASTIETKIVEFKMPEIVSNEDGADLFNDYFKTMGRTIQITEDIMSFELLKSGSSHSLSQIANYVWIRVFSDTEPIVKNLFTKLLLSDEKEIKEIYKKLYTVYLEIAASRIKELNAKTEPEFPVNILREEVKNEEERISLPKPSDDEIGEMINNEYANFVEQRKKIEINGAVLTNFNKEEAQWQDFGYYTND